ncbi:MAG: hypothetical protein HFF89_04230 [Oscillibacter sp.]|nr:hypothetical protein [Oscillibacter sp.]MCI9375750.1 hypothetical protein [Oscillibacter sp.]
MFLLTNEQRASMGLGLIEPEWEWMRLKGPENGNAETWACFDGDIIRKSILEGPAVYVERDYEERTIENRTVLLARTGRGAPKKLSATSLGWGRRSFGMRLSWSAESGAVELWHTDTARCFYSSGLDGVKVETFADFQRWAERWEQETTPEDLDRLKNFIEEKRRHQKAKEGDFFRFQIGRREYGYGRVLLDYEKMRKQKKPFWDILMGKPLVTAVYQIITDNPAVSIEELSSLPMLPSRFMADDLIYYGEYPIIGNLPLEQKELDFPVMYGTGVSARDRGKRKVYFQCGRIFRELEGVEVVPGCETFRNNTISVPALQSREVLEECMAAGDNRAFWRNQSEDLRAYPRKLKAVCRQFSLLVEDLYIKK